MASDIRIGYGYDLHRLESGRKLILGGVQVPHDRGLLGHSDADVLLHAITDALLGALAMGDIGSHFPDDDPDYKDADSRILLKKVYDQINEKGYKLINTDTTIIAQKPKLREFIDDMRKNIAADLKCDIDQVSVKATTSEKIGYLGREEGIAAIAVVILAKTSSHG